MTGITFEIANKKELIVTNLQTFDPIHEINPPHDVVLIPVIVSKFVIFPFLNSKDTDHKSHGEIFD